ncbi:sulfurtransferase [Nodularia sp. NIES-3585]|uniref:sulfurtransferase n=1 Tax=Nodularia sp. NIES-3585 TaxID=1973477 RepID=UPI000B5CA260|nr:sulfurtransferase [Nodularia sp. NIES-3585]GAX35192.1 rhodanese domain-containing protein [Nodularia sp. NIES-3585]
MDTKFLISPQELTSLLAEKASQIAIIDTRSPEEYVKSHLPGAINIRELFTYLLENSQPDGLKKLSEHFSELLSKAGISGAEQLIIYEDTLNQGYGQSCRAAFVLKYLGCTQVSVLHGGYKAWLMAGLPTTYGGVHLRKSQVFTAHPDAAIMVTTQEMLQALDNPKIIKLDVRDRNEWQGLSSSPYSPDFCPRKGRIPNAVWLEWHRLMNCDSQIPMFRSPAEILEICQSVGITSQSIVYIYCFKGSRAANTMIALQQAGIYSRNYFGSWNEWSRDFSLPIDSRIIL